MVSLLVIRHAESVWNAESVWSLDRRRHGHANPDLPHAGVVHMLERYFDCVFERIGNLGGRRILVKSGEVRLRERIALTGDGACLTPTAATERR